MKKTPLYYAFQQLKNPHHYDSKKLCSTYFAGLKKNDKDERPNQIFKAVNQVIDALLFYWDREESFITKQRRSEVIIMYPIIVFDGKLFTADVYSEKTEVQETNHIQLMINREVKDPLEYSWLVKGGKGVRFVKTKPFIIDVVRKDYFEEFLKTIK